MILEGYKKSNHSILKTDYEKFRATISNNVNENLYTFEIDEHLFEIDLSQHYPFAKRFFTFEIILKIVLFIFVTLISLEKGGSLSSGLFILFFIYFCVTTIVYHKLKNLVKILIG